MKNAPITISNESALDKCDYTAGTMPKRVNTVTADVLAYLLESNSATGMETVFRMSSTRLAAVIHYLYKRYGWIFERKDIVVGTNDGRIPTIKAYWLSQATIACAFEKDARTWIDKVRSARAKRREQADMCKALAAKINAAHKQAAKSDPRQGALWGEI